MKKVNDDKPNKLVIDILKDLNDLKQKIHSDFIKVKIMELEVKIKKLL